MYSLLVSSGGATVTSSMKRDITATNTEEQRFPYSHRNLKVIALSNLLASLGFGLAWPFLPLVVRGFGVQENLATWVGNMVLGFYIVSFTMNPIWGGIADHYGRKIMVLRATVGMGVCFTLVPFAPSPLWFAALIMMVGLFNGSTAASMALLVANTPPKRIGSALSLSQTGTLVGQTMGPAVGALLMSVVDRYHSLFWLSGGLFLAATVLIEAFVHEVKQLAPGRWRLEWIAPLRELVRVPRIGPLYLLAFVFSMLWSGNVTIMSLYVLQLLPPESSNVSNEAFWVGAVAVALGVSGLVAMPVWGRVLDRHDPARVLAFATAAAAVTHVPLLFIETPLQLVIARVAFGISAAAMQPAIVRLLKEHAPKGMDARAISYGSSFQFMAMGLAPFIAGLVGPALGLRVYFALTIVLTVVGVVSWVRSGR
jgi:DHA1 family multidrug resistance protein-like MFS transporter